MSVFPDKNNSISCRCCGFVIKLRQTNQSASVFCPSCGDEQPQQREIGKELSNFNVSGLKKKDQSETKAVSSSKTTEKNEKVPRRRYGILFFTVCLQLAIVAFSPVFIQNWSKEPILSENEAKSEKTISKKKNEKVSVPEPQIDKANPSIAKKADVPTSLQTKDQLHKPQETSQKPETATVVSAATAPTDNNSKNNNDGKNELTGPFAAGLAAVQDCAPEQKLSAPEKLSVASIWDLVQKPETALQGFRPPDKLSEKPATTADGNKTIVEEHAKIPNDLKSTEAKIPQADLGASQYELRFGKAKEKLSKSYSLIALEPERALTEAVQAIRMFEELGQSIPSLAYWTIAQAYAVQSWGESLIEASPPIESLAVSSDSRWLLTQTDDNTVWIWDLFRTQKSNEGFRLDASETPFVKLLFTPDFRLAIGGETNGTIKIWDTSQKRPAESTVSIRGILKNIHDLQVSPDGRWLVAYGGSVETSNHRTPTVPIQARYAAPTPNQNNVGRQSYPPMVPKASRPRQPGFSKSDEIDKKKHKAGEIILVNYREKGLSGFSEHGAANSSNTVWLWDLNQVRSGNIPQPIALRGHERSIMTMKISDDSRWLVTGSEDGTARVYDLKGAFPGADQAVLKGHELGITSIAIPSKGNWIATGSRDNTIRLWNLPNANTPTACTVLSGHIGWISALAVDESGQRLVSGSYDQTIRIWTIPQGKIDLADDNPPLVIQNDQGPIRDLLLSKDGRTLVSLGGDASLRVRELNGEIGQTLFQDIDPKLSLLIRNRMLPITRVLLTPDDQWLVFNYVNQKNLQNSGVRLWPIRLKDLIECASAFGN